MMRTDRGNEKGIMGSMQICLRNSKTDEFAKKLIVGRSTKNQRFQSLQGQPVTGFYMDLFKSMHVYKYIDIDNPKQMDC